MNDHAPLAGETLILDDRIRGVPPGAGAILAADVARRNWRPTDGSMSLPVLTLDEAAFLHNRDLMLAYVRSAGDRDRAARQDADGAGSRPPHHRRRRLGRDRRRHPPGRGDAARRHIAADLANEVGGLGGARRLASLVAAWPEAELYVVRRFGRGGQALASAWRDNARCRR